MSQLRVTRQIAPDHWITYCKACPKRSGRRSGPTEQAVDVWWAKHVQTRLHQSYIQDDGSLSPEEVLLGEIFGKPATPKRDKRTLAGELIVRPKRTRVHRNDNPKGGTP